MTQVLSPTPEALALASQLLHDGQLVAFPTETVYGLGANALDAKAVLNIFAAKGRKVPQGIRSGREWTAYPGWERRLEKSSGGYDRLER